MPAGEILVALRAEAPWRDQFILGTCDTQAAQTCVVVKFVPQYSTGKHTPNVFVLNIYICVLPVLRRKRSIHCRQQNWEATPTSADDRLS